MEEIKIRLSQRPQGGESRSKSKSKSRSKSKSKSKSRSRSKLNDDLIDSPSSSSGLRLETRKKLSRGKNEGSQQLK